MELHEEIKEFRNHLRYLKGQIEAVEKMLDNGKSLNDVYNQFKALEGTMDKAAYILLEEILRKKLALKIVKAVDACPGDCSDAEKIQLTKNAFPNLEINKVASIISEMDKIKERLDKLNSQ